LIAYWRGVKREEGRGVRSGSKSKADLKRAGQGKAEGSSKRLERAEGGKFAYDDVLPVLLVSSDSFVDDAELALTQRRPGNDRVVANSAFEQGVRRDDIESERNRAFPDEELEGFSSNRSRYRGIRERRGRYRRGRRRGLVLVVRKLRLNESARACAGRSVCC
jgi:hypothetical protein